MAGDRQSETAQSPIGLREDSSCTEKDKSNPDAAAAHLARVKQVRPVKELASLNAFPAAAREREILKAAHTFASTGRNVFVHYVEPILDERRRSLLADGTTRKKYYKSAAQVWQLQTTDQRAFWDEKARELRMCMKQGLLGSEDCLRNAGKRDEWQSYLWYAESAIAAYLDQPHLQPPSKATIEGDSTDPKSNTCKDDALGVPVTQNVIDLQALAIAKLSATDVQSTACAGQIVTEPASERHELLDTLPDCFECDKKTMYEPFALFDFDQIRAMEGKQQVAELRRIAEMMHKTGKDLFHHFMYPRLCRSLRPPVNGDTVASVSADIWRFLSGVARGEWLAASRDIKQQLGNGDVLALERIQLNGEDAEVFKLHALAETALESHMASRKIGALLME